MNRLLLTQRIIDHGIVAVVRASDPTHLVEVIRALSAGGVKVAEITLTVPGALEVLKKAKEVLGSEIILGAGTVLDPESARAAILAGADFIVAPTLHFEVIKLCHRYDRAIMPGAFSPTEILAAWEAGADIVKVFPAEVLGVPFFKAMRGPLPQIKMMPTGGVDLRTASEFLKAGACCLGIGSQLIDPKAIQSQNWKSLENLANQYVQIVQQTRTLLA